MAEFHAGDGVRIRYRDEGSGALLVLVHGWMMSHRFFDQQFRDLANEFRVVAPDLRGCGASDARRGTHHVPRYAQDLRELLDELQAHQGVLVGWSMGGGVVAELLLSEGPRRVAGIGLVDFPPRLEEDPSVADKVCHNLAKRRDTFVRDFIGRMFLRPPADPSWMVEEALQCAPDTACEMYRAMRPSRPDPTPAYPKVPAWLAFPDKGWFPAARPAWEEAFPRHVAPPFPMSKHCPFLEEPDTFNDSLAAFTRACHADA